MANIITSVNCVKLKRKARRQEEEIPQQRAGRGREQSGAAPDKTGLHHHSQQIDQGQRVRIQL